MPADEFFQFRRCREPLRANPTSFKPSQMSESLMQLRLLELGGLHRTLTLVKRNDAEEAKGLVVGSLKRPEAMGELRLFGHSDLDGNRRVACGDEIDEAGGSFPGILERALWLFSGHGSKLLWPKGAQFRRVQQVTIVQVFECSHRVLISLTPGCIFPKVSEGPFCMSCSLFSKTDTRLE